jgi:hypothetical protein
MAKQALTVKVHIDGVRETLAAFRKLPKDASNELRDASMKISQTLVTAAKRNAGIDPQSTAVATTVKVVRDRVPAVQAGGAKRVTSNRAPAWALLFASEFGMTRRSGWYANPRYGDSAGRQYSPHQGQKGRWFFPAVENERTQIAREWNKAVDVIVRKFGEGG